MYEYIASCKTWYILLAGKGTSGNKIRHYVDAYVGAVPAAFDGVGHNTYVQ